MSKYLRPQKFDSFQGLQEAMNWETISCPFFEKLLYYNSDTKVYKSDGKVVNADDPRLIAYLEKQKDLKPVDLTIK